MSFLDFTQQVSRILPAVPFNLVINLGAFLAGMIVPFWGVVGGLGFPIGQLTQAAHAFDPKPFEDILWFSAEYKVNFWNIMEMTFGTFAGLMLALGLWLNRKHISQTEPADEVTILQSV